MSSPTRVSDSPAWPQGLSTAPPITTMPREAKYAPSTLLRPATSVAVCSANSSSDSVARPAGFQNAASPRPDAAMAVCPIPTACAPTGNTRNSAPALRGSSCAERWNEGTVERLITARMENRNPIPTFQRSIFPSEALRLIDEHDGNVVFDGVHQAAGVTGKRFRIRPMLERAFAFRADENRE